MDDLIVVGGGMAGLTAALDVARAGFGVTVIERKAYPQHKVCGEYVSNEILPYYERLGIPLRSWQPRSIRRLRLHAISGRSVEARLPLGGLGLRRFTLDEGLYRLARDRGVRFALNTRVDDVRFVGDRFALRGSGGLAREARCVIGSFGKRASLDRRLARPFTRAAAPDVALKFYLEADFPDDLVALHGLEGGYAGAVRVEDGTVDVACLLREADLRGGGLASLEERVLHRSPPLRSLLTRGRRIGARPLVISNVSFAAKDQIRDHVLMIGDAAGMIPPLCGNGMAMGVHAAKLACESVVGFLSGRMGREEAEARYRKRWHRAFDRRLRWGRLLHPFLRDARGCEVAVAALQAWPSALPALIRGTHGTAVA